MVDTHCHLSKEIYENLDEIINNMKGIMIISATNTKEIKEVIELTEKYDNIYATIGIHPEEADNYKEDDLKYLESFLNHPKVVGIGEIGLDYHYTKENKENQKELFIKQLKLANIYHKTLVIHCREALEDAYNILKEVKNKELKGVMHCYSGNIDEAKKLIEINMSLGIGGVLTFKNEKTLKEVVKTLDIENFVLETDSPYLTPEPFRGKKNEPANVKYVANKISELKNITLDEVANITTANAKRLFDLPF